MKRLSYFAVLAVAVLACNKIDDLQEPVQSSAISFNASVIENTKTTLVDNVKTHWSVNDSISVFGATGTNYWFQTSIIESAATAVFDRYSPDANIEEGLLASLPYVLYPYDGSATISGSTITTTINTTQNAVAGDFSKYQKPLLVAKSDASGNLTFNHASTVLKFTVGEENLTWISFKGNAGEIITGTTTVTLTDDGTVTTSATQNNWLTINPPVGETYFTKGTTYYCVIAPQTFSSGITVDWEAKAGYVNKKTTSSSIEAEAGHILNLGDIIYTEVSASAPTITLNSDNTATAGTAHTLNLTFADDEGLVSTYTKIQLIKLGTSWGTKATFATNENSPASYYLNNENTQFEFTLPAVTSYDLSVDVTFPEAGTYYVYLWADSEITDGTNSLGKEPYNENNGTATITIEVTESASN